MEYSELRELEDLSQFSFGKDVLRGKKTQGMKGSFSYLCNTDYSSGNKH